MNGSTHESYAKAVARLIVAHGFAPGADQLLPEGRFDFVLAASLPDRVSEVACSVPGRGPQTELLGHNLSSFEHFQVFQRGYRWLDDPSIALSGPAEVVAKILAAVVPGPGLGALVGAVADLPAATATLSRVAGARISLGQAGTRPPIVGILRDSPMQIAAALQPGWPLGTFFFPSAASGAAYYAMAAQRWSVEGDAAGWRRCAGYALHLVQDCCVPHHAWGALLMGHSAWEDALEAEWQQTFAEVIEANLFGETIAKAVASELVDIGTGLSVADLCAANAAWAVARFGGPRDLAECPGDVALRVSVRAVAASVRACELMTGG